MPVRQRDQHVQQLSSHFKTLHSNPTGSETLASIALLTQKLNQGSHIIQERLSKRPLCFNQQPSAKANILKNVFFKYYIGKVQPYLSRTHKIATQWREEHLKVLNAFTLQDVQSEPLERYLQSIWSEEDDKSLWKQYLQAKDNHVKIWQHTLKQCGMLPSSS